MGYALIVSIHDVTPALAADVQALWSLCASRGVEPALLVVPQWHGAHPIEEAPSLVSWLRERAAHGAEIFLHGERHDEAGLGRRWTDTIRALGRTAAEGEFLTLEEPAARERIERGLSRLRRLGLDPIGFVAPAWLARRDTYRAVAAAGLGFSEDEGYINLHRRATRLRVPVIRWSARSAARARVSAWVADLRWRLHRDAWVVRIALHPSDLHHPVTARSLEATLDRWLARRWPIRYAEL